MNPAATPSFYDDSFDAFKLRTVPVQIGDVVLAWHSPGVFSPAVIEDITYGDDDTTTVTCRALHDGQIIANDLASVNTVPVFLLASLIHSYVENWASTPIDKQYERLLLIARLLESHARAARLLVED